MAVIFDFVSKVGVPSVAPTSVVDAFRENWKTSLSQKWQIRLLARTSDPEAWNGLAELSSREFNPFVDPAFISQSGLTADQIKRKKLEKMRASHQSFLNEIDAVSANDFAEMKTKIDRKTDRFAVNVLPTLASTGTRVGLRGPGVKHDLAFTADPSFQRDLHGGDTISGNFEPATPFVDIDIRTQLRAALMGILTQAIVGVLRGDDPAVYNARLDTLVTNNLDPAYVAPPTSFIHLEIPADNGLELHTHIETP